MTRGEIDYVASNRFIDPRGIRSAEWVRMWTAKLDFPDAPIPRSRLPVWVLCHEGTPVQTAARNCTRDEGGPFGFGNQVLIPSHRELLSSKAMVVNVAETSGL